jgi:hypothetical protein
MTSADVAKPSRQALQAKKASRPGQVSGALKVAIDNMVENGARWDQAAMQAGLTVRSMRLSLQKPHVLAHLRQQRHVLIESVCAANPQRLAAIRDSDRNLAASVRAVSELESMAGSPATRAGSVPLQPGLTIQIITRADAVKVAPTIEHDPSDDEALP